MYIVYDHSSSFFFVVLFLVVVGLSNSIVGD